MNTLSPEVNAVLIAVTIGILSGIVNFLINRQFRATQLLESGARADLSLNINVLPTVLKINDQTSILETRIEITNNSRKTCCIPAVYVSARALVRSGLEGDYLGESSFTKLEECEKLSEISNVALMEKTVIQLAPDEIERFVRWDTLDESFIERYPVVVVNVEVISVPSEFIGEQHYPKFKEGKYRRDWIQFMNEGGGKRHSNIIVGRLPLSDTSENLSIKPGRRCLLLPSGEPDIENTQKFSELLEPMFQWSRHVTVSLSVASSNKSIK
jgi:hypothetical protein